MESPFQNGSTPDDVLHLEIMSSWLRKHGKPVRPRLDRRQLDALRECFDIIDTDGTGVITAEELQEVFKVCETQALQACSFVHCLAVQVG